MDSLIPNDTQETIVDETVVDSVETDQEVIVDETVDNEATETERPEWLPEGFESAEELAEKYKELNTAKAPEEYELGEYEGFEFYEGDNDISAFKSIAQEYDIPQEGFNKMVELYVQSETQKAQASAELVQSSAQEMLGDNASERIESFAAKARASLSAENFELLQLAASNDPRSAGAVVQLMEQFIGKQEAKPLGTATSTISNAIPRDELAQMAGDARFGTDAAFTKKVLDGYNRLG